MNQALASFPYFVSVYHGFPKKWSDSMIDVFAAKDMLNETLLDLKRYARDDIILNLYVCQHEDFALRLKEFHFTYEFRNRRLQPAVRERIANFIQTIDEQITFLNSQIEKNFNEIDISTFLVGNGLYIAVCQDLSTAKQPKYLKDVI